MSALTGYMMVFLTILLTVYGQLVLKWRVILAGMPPAEASDKLHFYLALIFNPWVLSTFAAAFIAALCWMTAMTRLELSKAYPFMALSFVLVTISANLLLGESITWPKIAGLVLIVGGLIVGSLT